MKKNPLSKKVFKSKKLQKWLKKDHKWPFFGLGGPNFDPFFYNFLQITSKYAQKHHIKKLKKIAL